MGRAFEVRKASMMKTGLAKSKVYVRYSREIYLAAKAGGSDVEANTSLKRLIEKAKKEQVPADVIKRAIDKVNSGGEDLQAKRYEGFGPNGATIIVDCLTDNDNRTISEVKNCFTKSKNKIGVSGAVAHMYDQVGMLSVKNMTEDEVMEVMIENGVDFKDIEIEGDITTIITDFTDFMNVRNALLTVKTEDDLEEDEITFAAQMEVELEGADKESFQKLIDMLNECDDVQNVYHNVTNM